MNSTPSIARRPFGDTEVELSIVGLGGVLVMNAGQEDANRVVAEACERSVNYFDVAPGYGNAEEKLGPALEPYRKDVFLACKTGQRERAAAQEEFEQSCQRLRTDYFDLYQLHGIMSVENDVDKAFGPDGVMGLLLEYRKQGRIRHIGFSAHTVEAAYAALDRFDFDSALFPLNFAAAMKNGFGPDILERARAKGAARLALKAMARQHWTDNHPQRDTYAKCWYEPLTDPALAELALRWTLSQDVTAAIAPGEEALFRMALDFAERFKPLAPGEEKPLEELAGGLNPIFPQAESAV